MNKKVAILFPCIGRRVSLLRLFRAACRRLGCEGIMVGTDTTENSAALQCCDRQYVVKPVTHRDYPGQIKEIVKREKVMLLVPTVDLDLSIWARRRAALSDVGCRTLISTSRVVRICQDKRLTFAFLKKHGFATPDTLSASQALRLKRPCYPYFLKPWDGHAGRGNAVARNREELKFYTRRVPNCIVQEFVEGAEYTVDVLVDFDGKVRCVVPRRRLAVRAGEVSKGITVKHAEIIGQSRLLVEKLKAGPGVITIQCFLTGQGCIKFIEINPRFGGGVPLSIQAGADFPRWLLEMLLGRQGKIRLDGWRDGLTMLRYDEAVWVRK